MKKKEGSKGQEGSEGGSEGGHVLDVFVGAFVVGGLDLLVVLQRPFLFALPEKLFVILG